MNLKLNKWKKIKMKPWNDSEQINIEDSLFWLFLFSADRPIKWFLKMLISNNITSFIFGYATMYTAVQSQKICLLTSKQILPIGFIFLRERI